MTAHELSYIQELSNFLECIHRKSSKSFLVLIDLYNGVRNFLSPSLDQIDSLSMSTVVSVLGSWIRILEVCSSQMSELGRGVDENGVSLTTLTLRRDLVRLMRYAPCQKYPTFLYFPCCLQSFFSFFLFSVSSSFPETLLKPLLKGLDGLARNWSYRL